MKNDRLSYWFLALFPLVAALSPAQAQNADLTYQGRLDQAGAPANGVFDLRFALFDAPSGGTSPGTNLLDNVGVTNGLFTVTLNFGASTFNGNNRWLEIGVRPGASTGAYTNLSPRQPITSAPYAIYASGANAAGLSGTLGSASLAGTYANAVTLNNPANQLGGVGSNLTALNASQLTSGTVLDARLSTNVALRNGGNTFNGTQVVTNGRVGIGTSTPGSPLTVVNESAASIFVVGTSSNNTPAEIVFSKTSALAGPQHFSAEGYAPNRGHFIHVSGADRLNISTNGNVGIGTTSPRAKLEVSNGGIGLQFIPGLLNGVVDPNAVTLEIAGNKTLGVWDDLLVDGTTITRNSLVVDGAGTSAGGLLGNSTTGLRFGASDSGEGIASKRTAGDNQFGLDFYTGYSARLSINRNGNVGIGTTTPGAPLEVSNGSIGLQVIPGLLNGVVDPNAVTLEMPGQKTLGVWDDLRVDGSAFMRNSLVVDAAGSNGGDLIPNGSPGLKFGGSNSGEGIASKRTAGGNQNGLDFYSSYEPRLSIRNDGNVGIGTTTPARKLTVNSPGYGFEHTDGAIRVGTYVGTGQGWLGTISTHALAFFVNDGGAAVTIQTDENVFFSREITCTAVNITSDRQAKEEFTPVNGREILAKVAALPISQWQYKTQSDVRHIGPMAQDFHAAFSVGRDDKHITSVDADGVALAAIQGLNEKVDEKDARIRELEKSVADLKALVERLAARQGGAQ